MTRNLDEEQLNRLLKQLPKPDLDDRKFEDLVAECILRIPRYCSEWTNHNPGDPGITLIELFAWLADQVLLRFIPNPVTTDYIHAIASNLVGALHATPLQNGWEYLLSNADLVSIKFP